MSFLNLPRELRDIIYDHHFRNCVEEIQLDEGQHYTADDAIKSRWLEIDDVSEAKQRAADCRTPIATHTHWAKLWNIFLISQDIHAEAEEWLWQHVMSHMKFVACHLQCLRGLKEVRRHHPDFHVQLNPDEVGHCIRIYGLLVNVIIEEMNLAEGGPQYRCTRDKDWCDHNTGLLQDKALKAGKCKSYRDLKLTGREYKTVTAPLSPSNSGNMYGRLAESWVNIDYHGDLFVGVSSQTGDYLEFLLIDGNLGRMDALWRRLEVWHPTESWQKEHMSFDGSFYVFDVMAHEVLGPAETFISGYVNHPTSDEFYDWKLYNLSSTQLNSYIAEERWNGDGNICGATSSTCNSRVTNCGHYDCGNMYSVIRGIGTQEEKEQWDDGFVCKWDVVSKWRLGAGET